MAIVLNHTIVPAHDKVASAQRLARILGLDYAGAHGRFAPVRINDTLTLDFDERGPFERHHYAFHVGEAEFDAILERVKADGLAFGSEPQDTTNGRLNTRLGGRGFYFRDANDHSWEFMTRV
jgi:catechol 2,3-dioxygenase-like lactoylglutathione lyase family enzyme